VAERWLADSGWEATGPPSESYLDGSEVAEPRTVVHVPLSVTLASVGTYDNLRGRGFP